MNYGLLTTTIILLAQPLTFQVPAPPKPKELPIKNAQTNLEVYGPWKGNARNIRPWSDVIGELVVAEGLAWGEKEKGLGQRVILDGSHVFIHKIEFGDKNANGKLVRVTGRLRAIDVPRFRGGFAQSDGGNYRYFCIDADKVELIDRVEFPYLAEGLARTK